MRICVLSDEEIQDFDVSPYLKEFDYEFVTMRRPVLDTLKALKERNEFDIYLNVCEGYEMDDEDENGYEGIEVVKALEELNLPFTGASSIMFDPTREEMQAAADAHGVGFAKGYRVKSMEEAEQLVKTLHFPVMVKHPQSYGSTGMIKESRCDSLDEVLIQVERVCREYGAARMEEFIVGKEFNVLVVDNPDDFSQPIAYPPTELIFPPGEEFWHTVVKWDTSLPFNFSQATDVELIPRLQDIAIRMFVAIGMVSYGRCDVRMNAQGELFVLEINPNPAIMLKPEEYGPADYMILYDLGGYKVFFERLFRATLIRHQQRLQIKND
jgi:D-alanine-D-alanine ligase-like ATP-grasp enzyme